MKKVSIVNIYQVNFVTDEVKVFESPKFGTIRTVKMNGKVLFCGKDIATALGYLNPKKAILDHCKENGITFFDIPTLGGTQKSEYPFFIKYKNENLKTTKKVSILNILFTTSNFCDR